MKHVHMHTTDWEPRYRQRYKARKLEWASRALHQAQQRAEMRFQSDIAAQRLKDAEAMRKGPVIPFPGGRL